MSTVSSSPYTRLKMARKTRAILYLRRLLYLRSRPRKHWRQENRATERLSNQCIQNLIVSFTKDCLHRPNLKQILRSHLSIRFTNSNFIHRWLNRESWFVHSTHSIWYFKKINCGRMWKTIEFSSRPFSWFIAGFCLAQVISAMTVISIFLWHYP